jgi:hypothetical protein
VPIYSGKAICRLSTLLTLFLIFGIADISRGQSGEEKVSLSGYYKSYFVALNEPSVTYDEFSIHNSPYGSANNRLRLNLYGRVNDYMALTIAYDIAPKVQDDSLFGSSSLVGNIESSIYRAGDLNARLYPGDSSSLRNFAVYQNLDRLFLTANAPFADIYFGRQAIAWGSARVINPTDVLAPFAFTELDIEDRLGVDAIRVRVPLGFMGELDCGYVAGDDFDYANSAMYLRGKFYTYRTDVTLLAIDFRENLLLGLDMTRAVGGAGTWLEAGYTFVGAASSHDRNSSQDYLRASMGADYSLRDGTYLFVEYHYSEAGSTSPDCYLSELSGVAFRDGAVYLLGQHYIIPGVSYQITPLIILSGEVLTNLTDPSVLLAPTLEYNISENIYISAGAYIGFGKGPSVENPSQNDPSLGLRSEFGSYPDIYFTSFRIYF